MIPHSRFSVAMLLMVLALAGCSHVPAPGVSGKTAKLTPADLSTIRGANYRGAAATNTTDYWLHYSPAETERDLAYADSLKLNQLRVFVNYASWRANKAAFGRNLVDLARACRRHHLGLMITIGDSQTFINDDGTINRDHIRLLVKELVSSVGLEPALAFWDASNEPDYNPPGSPRDRQQKRFEIARLIAATLHEFDRNTPVTIGAANERNMEALADAVDVLSFHDYLPTRAAISNDIARAKAFAAKNGKLVMDTEIGCIARANPYDVTLEEHMKARVGWYIWELMITKRWGDVHGVYYPDGTVRDPAIPAAMFGLFRNRSDTIVLEFPDREGCVGRAITNAQACLDNDSGNWAAGLNAAETLANLLESAQLVAMRELPTRTVNLLRQGPTNNAALRELLPQYVEMLRPYQKPAVAPPDGGTNQVTPLLISAASTPINLTSAVAAPSATAGNAAVQPFPMVRRANSRTPADTSTIRGANYCYAEYGGHFGMWSNYSPAITERDLNYARRLGINQIRCFLSYPAFQSNSNQFRQNLLHLVRAADQRGIGVMPVVGYSPPMRGEGYPGTEEWAKFLVETLGKEPGLAFWDVFNEPDYPPTATNHAARIALARHMAGVFRRLDGQTPVTIGFAFETNMEKYVEDVDVLVFHQYLPTRGAMRAEIERAKQVAAAAHKQVMDDEIGCVARANPYDVTIQEHMNAHVGYYLWELMIVWNGTRGWGNVHGIFYPDGTIRDPSIPMAVMGIFRNRGPDVVLERPDREGRVTRTITDARRWLAEANGDWHAGLDIAEAAANLLESAQLVPLHELPTRQVELLQRGPEDRTALTTLLNQDIAALQPYER